MAFLYAVNDTVETCCKCGDGGWRDLYHHVVSVMECADVLYALYEKVDCGDFIVDLWVVGIAHGCADLLVAQYVVFRVLQGGEAGIASFRCKEAVVDCGIFFDGVDDVLCEEIWR